HDLVHRGARLANTEELREVGQAQELAPQRTPTRRERLKVLGANISEAGDERLLWTQLAKLTQFARVGGIFDVRSGCPRARARGDARGADEHAPGAVCASDQRVQSLEAPWDRAEAAVEPNAKRRADDAGVGVIGLERLLGDWPEERLRLVLEN